MPYIISPSHNERFILKTGWVEDDPLRVYRKETNHRAKNGVPIPEHAAPKTFHAKSKAKRAPDFFSMFSEIAVSEQFKSILEALEPDVHQFFPVKGIHPQTGEPRTLDCYVFNCCNLVDGGFVEPQERLIIREMVMRPDGTVGDIERDNSSECEGEYWRYKLKHRHPYRLNKAKVGDKHCWLDRHHDSYLFVSDEFHAALVKNNIQAALENTRFFPLEGKDYGEGT